MSTLRPCRLCGSAEASDARYCSRCGTRFLEDSGRERRAQVTIVFCDLADSTALGERLDPEVLRAVQARYFACAAAALRAHGGQVEKYIGDAVMCVFGLPSAHEDDALRATRGAWDLVKAVEGLSRELRAELDVELAVRVGVNTGEVVAGDHSRGQAFVTGDAVNVAARLEQAAPAGAVVIGDLTHTLVKRHIRAAPIEPIHPKGKTFPLAAWRLLGLTAGAPHAKPRAALVGRVEELAALRALLASVESQGRAQFVLVCGEAGIGKSRLVAEFASKLSGSALTGTCPSYGRGNTYRPLRDVTESLLRRGTHEEFVALLASRPDAATIATRLRRLMGRETGTVAREEAFDAVANLFAALAADAPLVVVFEDLHWAEPSLLDLLEFLDRNLTAPVLIIGTAREEFVDERPPLAARVIRLQRLTDDEAAELLTRGGARTPAEVERLVVRAGGKPRFLEQLAAWRGEGRGRLPPDVASLIAARLDLLDSAERLVIEAAAVVGRDFLPAAVRRLLADEKAVSVPSSLARLEAAEFVMPGASSAVYGPTGLSGVFGAGRLHFRHALVFDAVRAAMPKARRAMLHERFADALATYPGHEVAVVGYHLEQAARLRMELRPRDAPPAVALAAATQLERAGLQALEHGDAPAADALLTRARDLLAARRVAATGRHPDPTAEPANDD